MTSHRAGILGGTFDPVHLGHLALAEQGMHFLELDRLVFIPTFQPPHKEWRPYASYQDRFEMLKRATQHLAHVEVSDLEKRRGGLSYTVDTLHELQALEPDTEWYFITGSDAYDYFMTWHYWQEILDTTRVVIAKRPGYEIKPNKTLEDAVSKSRYGMRHLIVDTPDISSTQVRDLLTQADRRDEVKKLLPAVVYDYIVSRRLYFEVTDDQS